MFFNALFATQATHDFSLFTVNSTEIIQGRTRNSQNVVSKMENGRIFKAQKREKYN